jgi:hypothetical protein
MKIYHEVNKDSSDIPIEDREKIAVLKLVDVGKYVANVGIRDGQFYVLAEDETDEVYLEYKEALANITKQMPPLKLSERMFEQKTMEFHNKKSKVVQMLMEMPR